MLGALAFVAVRQHQGQAVDAAPLDFARSDELVDHDLGAVGEVAELGFPNHQGVGVVGGVAVFKGQDRFFGQDRVDDHERGLAVGSVLQRHVSALVPLLAVLIVDDGVAVREGAAAAVFARQTHGEATGDQRGKGHVLTHAPVHGHVTAAHGRAVGVDLLDQLVRRHVLGDGRDFLGQAVPLCQGNRGVTRVGPLLAEEWCPVDGELGFEVGQHRVGGVLARVQRSAIGLDHVIAQGLTQALRGQLVGVHLARAGVGRDFFVHQGLGQRGGVLFVVAEFAEAHDVDDHVLAESHAVFQRQLRGQDHGFGVVTIDVQHRRFDHLDDVGAKHARAHVARVGGGETDLVVHDDVHRAARGVTPGLGQSQGFLVHALATKGRVAVHQNRQHLAAGGVAAAVHAGAHRTFDHGVDDFQVRGVEGQGQVNRATGGAHVGAEALVVLHVARWQVFGCGVVELGEQVGRQLAHGVDQHIQAAAVGHANDDFLHAFGTGLLDQLVHGGDEALTTFQRKPFLAHVLGVQKALQAFGRGQALQDGDFLIGVEIGFAADALELFLPPALFVLLRGVHVLDTQGAAVGFAQRVEQIAQRHAVLAKEGVAGVEHGFLVGVGEAVERGVQIGDVGALGALERIEVGPTLADVAVSRDELLHGGALAAHFGVFAGLDDLRHARFGALGKGVDDRQVRHIFGL